MKKILSIIFTIFFIASVSFLACSCNPDGTSSASLAVSAQNLQQQE